MRKFFDMLLNERGEVNVSKKVDDKTKKDDDQDVDPEPDPALDEGHQSIDVDPDDADPDGDIEVDLDTDDERKNKAAQNAKAAQKRLDEEKATLRRENELLKQQVDDLRQSRPSASQNYNVDPNDFMNWSEKQWDELAKKDWKKAVDLRAEIKARQQLQAHTESADFNRVLEESKSAVLRRHPELADPTSEKAKLFRNIVTANPEYTTMKKGPIHAMREMEEYMEQNLGYKREDIVKAEAKARQDERSRIDRVQISSTAGRNVSDNNKVVLTKDEIDFCSMQGIDPKVYAANKRKLEKSGRGGIQL